MVAKEQMAEEETRGRCEKCETWDVQWWDE